MLIRATSSVGLCLALTSAVVAQGEPPNVDQSRIVRAAEAVDRPFADPGNSGAKAVAQTEGISVGEATSRLQRQWALNQFIKRLQQRNPDLFSFVQLRGGELTVGLTDPNFDITTLLPPGLSNVRKGSGKIFAVRHVPEIGRVGS